MLIANNHNVSFSFAVVCLILTANCQVAEYMLIQLHSLKLVKLMMTCKALKLETARLIVICDGIKNTPAQSLVCFTNT